MPQSQSSRARMRLLVGVLPGLASSEIQSLAQTRLHLSLREFISRRI